MLPFFYITQAPLVSIPSHLLIVLLLLTRASFFLHNASTFSTIPSFTSLDCSFIIFDGNTIDRIQQHNQRYDKAIVTIEVNKKYNITIRYDKAIVTIEVNKSITIQYDKAIVTIEVNKKYKNKSITIRYDKAIVTIEVNKNYDITIRYDKAIVTIEVNKNGEVNQRKLS